MAENELEPPVLGISWDGSGCGPDETVWGGEFLWVNDTGYERAAHLRTFALPGSEKAVKEPRRSALGVLHELFGADVSRKHDLAPIQTFARAELRTFVAMLEHDINSPRTSSAGRLFDAVASLLGLRQIVRFEGQAAMELESLATFIDSTDEYAFQIAREKAPLVLDWRPMIIGIRNDLRLGIASAIIARKFHNTLVSMMICAAEHVFSSRHSLEKKVALTGGCFQNKLLTELAVQRLSEAGYRVYWHQRIPPNDGGISVGQVIAAARQLRIAKEE